MHTSQTRKRFAIITAVTAGHGLLALTSVASKADDGFLLGKWVASLRKRRDKLATERKARLDAIGFIWDDMERRGERGFRCVLEYKERHGDCLVPRKWPENRHLGRWVYRRQKRLVKLTKDQTQRLNEIGFVWDPDAE